MPSTEYVTVFGRGEQKYVTVSVDFVGLQYFGPEPQLSALTRFEMSKATVPPTVAMDAGRVCDHLHS